MNDRDAAGITENLGDRFPDRFERPVGIRLHDDRQLGVLSGTEILQECGEPLRRRGHHQLFVTDLGVACSGERPGGAIVFNRLEVVTRLRNVIPAHDEHRCARAGFLDGTAPLVEHRPNPTSHRTGDDGVAASQGPRCTITVATGPRPLSSCASMTVPEACRRVRRVVLEFGDEIDVLEQMVDSPYR